MRAHFSLLRLGLFFCLGSLSAWANRVDIYWTEHGVPHIEARDWYSLGYGSAWAVSSQNFCVLADQFLKVRSERSKHFGPGKDNANIISDISNIALDYRADARELFAKLSPRAQQLIRGYAAGFNAYLKTKNTAEYPRPCRGATWIKPTSEYELLAYYLSLAERASGQVLAPALVNAAPPISPREPQLKEALPLLQLFPQALIPDLDESKMGSNAWGIGRSLSESGGGLLLGNPHFPGYGALRFYQYRQRIPGVYDVQGASILGSPCIQIGFNNSLGWSHTVSKSRHFTFYQLELNPQNPLEYRYGNHFRPITKRDIAIEVLLPTGQIVNYSRPVFFSHYGPMIATPELKWDLVRAYTYRDANRRNIDFIDQWIDMGAASNIRQFKAAFQKYRGTPWVNTIYADKKGNALYIEGTPVPYMSQEALAAWKVNPLAQALHAKSRIFLFDGTGPRDEWQGGARGLVPYALAPVLQRSDYVANQNDSHWVINEKAKLEGYSPLYGSEKTLLSYRSRMGFKMLGDESGHDGKFSLFEVESALFSNRAYLWEAIGDLFKSLCSTWTEDSLVRACKSLGEWDGRLDLDSRGFFAFREFAGLWKPEFHGQAFAADRPLTTPTGISSDPILVEQIKAAFSLAVQNIEKSALPLMASLRELQFFALPDFDFGFKERIPYHGGNNPEGAFNIQDWDEAQHHTLFAYPSIPESEALNKETYLTKDGYPLNGGASFLLLAEFGPRGPRARGLLTYSQSSDPDSPHFSDQNHLFAEKKLRDFPHDWRDIERNETYIRQTFYLK